MKEKVLSILQETRPEFDFSNSMNFVEDGYLDSFDVVTIVSELEKEFNIIIDGLEIIPENFESVGKICDLVQRSTKRG